MTGKLKILHVYRTFFPDTHGGLEQAIRQIARGTSSPNCHVKIFTVSKGCHKTRSIDVDGIDVYQAPQLFEYASVNVMRRGWLTFRRLAKWADVVHFHFPWPFGDLLRLLVPLDTPVVVTYHSDIIRQKRLRKLYAPLMHRFFQSCDRIVSTSPNYLRSSSVLNRYMGKVDVIPLGLERSTYPVVSSDRLSELEQEYGRGFFLFVGVLRYYKGLHILLEAIKDTDFRVLIVGAGPIEAELHKKAKELKLNNVEFLGYVDDESKLALFELCQAVVFPSFLRSEAFGMTLLEGAMLGKPLISSEIGTGTSYVNIDGETGLVVPPSDPLALRSAMTLMTDDRVARRLGDGAKERFGALFSGKRMGRAYIRLYERILRGDSVSSYSVLDRD
jgi:glycosyltransferase involved in cell wall biosynthesis